MKILITGPNGFIAKNLQRRLLDLDFEISFFRKEDDLTILKELVVKSDFIFHLSGVNRTQNIVDFKIFNDTFTKSLCDIVKFSNKKIPIVFASSIQAGQKNPYGESKLACEKHLSDLVSLGSKIYIYRLPNVFGKWSRINYNSVVATFCHNILNDLPIVINDNNAIIKLLYIDDLLDLFINLLINFKEKDSFIQEAPYEEISVGKLAETLKFFKDSSVLHDVGVGLTRKLYATYLSFKSPNMFSYKLKNNFDERGNFVEFIKTKSVGQFSFFTMRPGIKRGGHYHHTKNEKFLVVKGAVTFNFYNLITAERYNLEVSELSAEVVETVPGWLHEIVNYSSDEAIIILWTNELFDKASPDTFSHKALL